MLIVKMTGGLGNQLFQFYQAYSLRPQNPNDIRLDLSFYKTKYTNSNGFELQRIYPNYIFQEVSSKETFYHLGVLSFFLYKYSSLSKYFKKIFLYRGILVDDGDARNTTNLNNFNAKAIIGYWHYIPLKLDSFKELFSLPIKGNSKSLHLINEIKHKNCLSIHIRRGDYLVVNSLNPTYKILDSHYYKNALSYFLTNFNIETILVFSDDIDEARKIIPHINAHFVDWNKGNESWQDMLLMSRSKYNIIANSTFSLWGAYLNFNNDSVICCPSEWCINNKLSPIIPDNWIQFSP